MAVKNIMTTNTVWRSDLIRSEVPEVLPTTAFVPLVQMSTQ